MAILFKNTSPAAFFLGSRIISKVLFKDNAVWENGPDLSKPLTFTSTGDSSVQLTQIGSPDDISLEYSIDNGEYTAYTIGETISLSDGQSVSMRAVSTNDTIGSSTVDYYRFYMSGSIAASGNIQSLLDKTCQRMDVPAYCYYYMFYGCTSLTQAPELPATTLASNCYFGMFAGCSSLTQAPELPATTLASGCYSNMFYNCTSLEQAPELPATTLADQCYYQMFVYCTSLTQAPELPATTLADACYAGMFSDCYNLQNMYFSNWNYDEAKSNLTNASYCQDMFANITTDNIQVQLNDGNTYTLTELLKSDSDSLPYLKFTNNDDNYQSTADIKLASYDSPNTTPQLEYSTDDGNNWYSFNINETYTIDYGNSMCIRASSDASYDSYFSDSNGYYRFESSYGPKFTVEGNIKYLLNQDDNYNSVKQDYTFKNLFQNFQYFHRDSNITIPYPDKVNEGYTASYCYQNMFDNSNISKITLTDNFTSWFDENQNDQYWTDNWVYNVPETDEYGNSGTFYCSSNLNQEFGSSRIPDNWNIETF